MHFQPEHVRLSVSVRFSSDGRLDVNGDKVTVSIKSEPKRGQANRELVKKLAVHFRVSEDRVRIVSGLTSRKKIVDVL